MLGFVQEFASLAKPAEGKSMSKLCRSFIVFCGLLGGFVVAGELSAQSIPLQGIPASDALGAEDIWGNPTFVGGVVNGGPTAHSEW